MSKKEEALELIGVVVEAVKGAFKVQMEEGDLLVRAKLAGSMRKNNIRVVPGDRVKVEVSPYDLSQGRIIYREK